MKKRVMCVLLLLCMVFTMTPTMVSAAAKTEVDKRTIEMKVKERRQYDGPSATNFASSNQDVVVIYQDGEISAKQAGTGTIYAYKGGKTVAAWKIIVGGGKPAPRPENTGGWPFVPSPDNKTNGDIHSGWYRIYTHDLGLWHVDEDGIVIPTRRVQYALYIEHLGNDLYYIYDPTGRYLSHKGSAKEGAQIVMSETPRKWRVTESFDGQKKYTFCSVENDKFCICTYGLCSETTDSRVKLGEMVTFGHFSSKYTLQGEGLEHYIPQWYKDFENGLSKPSTTEPVRMFGDPPAALKYTARQEWDVLRMTNNERAKAGLPMLITTDAMQKVAGVRSDELMQKYSHTRPNGSDPFTVFGSVGIYPQNGMAAENIAKNQGLAEAVMKAWMTSPGHKANILTPGLRYMGTGRSYNTEAHWVQIFATTANSDCKSISFNREQGYFTLKLYNGATAYAPYAKDTPPESYEAVTFNYPGVKTIEGGEGNPAEKPIEKPPVYDPKDDGWYYMRLMGNYINDVVDGEYQLYNRDNNMRVFPEVVGDGVITLKTSDDEYFGLYTASKNGEPACPVEEPYKWKIYKERGDDVFSLRPADNPKMVLNASGEKKEDGTPIIVWPHEKLNAPAHAEIQFVPVNPPKAAQKEHPFTDVKAGSYYEDAVVWALKNKVTSGTSATTFDPNSTCMRGQVVTFLWNAKGSPEPKSASNPFTDIKPADYYYKAVLWAVENGITSGTSATTFSPTATCTSGQVVTFLWNSNGSPNKTGQGKYYADAVNWGNANGLLSGTATTFAPNNYSPRADIVTYLYRNSKK